MVAAFDSARTKIRTKTKTKTKTKTMIMIMIMIDAWRGVVVTCDWRRGVFLDAERP